MWTLALNSSIVKIVNENWFSLFANILFYSLPKQEVMLTIIRKFHGAIFFATSNVTQLRTYRTIWTYRPLSSYASVPANNNLKSRLGA